MTREAQAQTFMLISWAQFISFSAGCIWNMCQNAIYRKAIDSFYLESFFQPVREEN